MVAISLYRGNLHRVSDVPRRWLMPEPQISLKDFKTLLARRSRALARLQSSSTCTESYPNPNPNPNSVTEKQEEAPTEEDRDGAAPESENAAAICGGGPSGERSEEKDSKPDVSSTKPIEEAVPLPDSKANASEEGSDLAGNGAKPEAMKAEQVEELANPNSESGKKQELSEEKLKRKKEVEEKLQVLNGRKHGLVQLLKQVFQVLNAEEELKRRISMQGMANCPLASLQVDATNDSVSMTRHLTPRMGSEPNLSGDPEAGEGDALSNQNLHSRQIFRMNSTSPSSESPIRRPPYLQHNPGLHPASRASIGATGSPSRFTPMGHQGQLANLPTVSVTGTNYIPSSPSPAASGGTSAFRDSRLPSPWN